ncbi:TlpA disulfide reductase family protein [Tabrizicola sp.]|uniref:TlpA family protein disulfide reductase n=1 Tax=Tabrizicola sp. TaxID=2005166 RepID=UPI002735EF83|nr:TlpA disulfide reductase family protein [Tabrizicola sp.]MDP3194114.1 TlpA disulfide reductase family protein [Tabrizicola sp.]
MRKLLVVLYTAFLIGANPALGDVAALRDGDMKKLALHNAPVTIPEAVLLDAEDGERSLADYRGKWVVLNFWATWCAPCRHEMPSLDRLQTAMPDLAVVPVATGRNAVEGIKRFFEEADIKSLPILRDPKSQLARGMGVMGLPVTVILNPEGQEVARLIGDAEWDSDSAKAVLGALMAGN